MEIKEQYLLEAKNLSKYFPVKKFFGKTIQQVKAVDRVSLSIKRRGNIWSGGRIRMRKIHIGKNADSYVRTYGWYFNL